MNKSNQNKYNRLRQKYSTFVFEGFIINDINDSLTVAYDFNIDNKHAFNPGFSIPLKLLFDINYNLADIENLIFQIGMVELVSYWKAACPQEVIIKAGQLDEGQVEFWKKLYYNGLGEFFYLNGINPDYENFMHLQSTSQKNYKKINIETHKNKVLLPIGGGKDSAVTVELLRNKFNVIPYIINPRKASVETANIAGFSDDQIFKVYRTIDPHLLELNSKGYLNGHTPFSALVAFMSLLSATLTKSHHVALSNESSANEPTIENGANHQYSKSYEFEKDFREYVRRYMTDDVQYFSFLRPLNEYIIARIFAKMTKYHASFRSCNAGSKNDEWCGKCPKCLFTFIMLSPFREPNEISQIFGKNLFEDESLIPYLEELTGLASKKPFECVGTIDEVNYALKQTLPKYSSPLPSLLKYYQDNSPNIDSTSDNIENQFDKQHFLENQFKEILTSALND